MYAIPSLTIEIQLFVTGERTNFVKRHFTNDKCIRFDYITKLVYKGALSNGVSDIHAYIMQEIKPTGLGDPFLDRFLDDLE